MYIKKLVSNRLSFNIFQCGWVIWGENCFKNPQWGGLKHVTMWYNDMNKCTEIGLLYSNSSYRVKCKLQYFYILCWYTCYWCVSWKNCSIADYIFCYTTYRKNVQALFICMPDKSFKNTTQWMSLCEMNLIWCWKL